MGVFISPSDHLVLSTDASNNAIGFGAFKFDPNTFQLQLAMTDSKLLNQADRNKSTITKEVISLLYCLHSMEYQIRQSDHEVILLSDAQSISQIQRFRNTSDYYLQISLFLASLKKVKILFIPGTANLVADSLSRRMADSYLKNENTQSPELANFIISLKDTLKPGTMLTPQQLSQFLLSDYDKTWINCNPKPKVSQDQVIALHKQGFDQDSKPENKFLCLLSEVAKNSPKLLKMGTIQNLLYNLESSRFPKNLLKIVKEKYRLAHESKELNRFYNCDSKAAEDYINNLRPPVMTMPTPHAKQHNTH